MDANLRVETLAVEKALDFLGGDRGEQIIREEMRTLAAASMMASMQKAPPGITIGIEEAKRPGLIAFLVGATHPTDNSGMRVPNWLNYGTRGRRRPAAKKPGRRLGRDANTGVKPRRFIVKVSKTKQSIAVGNAVATAAKRAGFDVSRWGG